MAVFRTCAGCHGEIDMGGKAHPQKNGEWYHDACNKKYEVWIKARQPIYEEVDKIRDEKLEVLRKSIFGDKSEAKLTAEEVQALQAKIKQDQTALNKARDQVGAA